MNPAILFVIGASGAGKTAAVDALEQQNLSGVGCYHFDSIAVPSADVMEQEWGGGERWQDQMTRRWIERLATNADRVQIAVLEGQTRPSFIRAANRRLGVRHARILLLDCPPAIRRARLEGPRAQPELNNERMDVWAAYLRGQADALELPVFDTTSRSVAEVADLLREQIDMLRASAGAAA
jgi:adenylate kinase family enzyme